MKQELAGRVAESVTVQNGECLPKPPAARILESLGAAVERSVNNHPIAWIAGLSLYTLVSIYQASRGKALWFDELFTFYISRLPTFRAMLSAMPYDGHPPAIYVLTRWSHQLFGPGEVATRLPEEIGFLVFCLCLFVYFRLRFSPACAVFAWTIPLITGAFNYAFEARPYGLLLGFAGVALISWQTATDGSRRKLGLAGLALSVFLGEFCHYYAVVQVVFPLAVAEMARTWYQKRIDVPVWFALAAGGIPVLIMSSELKASSWMSNARTSPVFWAKPTLDSLISIYSQHFAYASMWLLLAIALVLIFRLFENNEDIENRSRVRAPLYDLWVGIGFLAVPLAVFVMTKFTTGYYLMRYSLTAIVAFPILVAWFLSVLVPRRMIAVLVLVYAFGALGVNAIRTLRPTKPFARVALDISLMPLSTELPVVISNAMLYLKNAHYAPPELVARTVFLYDIKFAFKQPDFMPEFSLASARKVLPGTIEDYETFMRVHDRFWVYYTGGREMEWLPERLSNAGYKLQLEKQHGDAMLFFVSRQ